MEERTISDKTVSYQESKIYFTIPEIKKWKDYEVERKIRDNNQCVLYLIKDGKGRKYVLKIFYPFSPFNVEVVERIYNLSRMGDFPKYLTKVQEWGYDQDLRSYYIVEEYIEGGDLGEYIKKRRLSKEELKEFVRQINEGLRYLHINEVVHSDIKPSNILVRSENPLVFSISDYNIGSIKPRGADIKATTFKLTPAYAAPERFTNIITEKADYWSLGISLLEIITGKNPFEKIDANLIVYKILTQGVEIPKDIEEYYKILCENLLNPNPDKRWGYNEVKEYLEGKLKIRQEEKGTTEQKEEFKITFNNKEYRNLEELLLSFLRSSEDFRSGVKLFKSKSIEKLLSDEDRKKLEEIREKTNDEDLILNLFINYKFPSLPVYVGSKKLSYETVINVLRKIRDGSVLDYEDKKIAELIRNYLENRGNNIAEYYSMFRESYEDMELERLLINFKNFIVPSKLNEEAMYKFAFTVLALVEKNYYLPQSLQNFRIDRDVIEAPNFIPIVGNLLTVEEFNNLRVNLRPNNPYYSRFIALQNSDISGFFHISEYLKISYSKILNQRVVDENSRFVKILMVLNRYLSYYKIRNPEVEYYLRNTQLLNIQNFAKVYNNALEQLVYEINRDKYQGSFPFIGILFWLFLLIVALSSIFGACSLYYSMSYVYRIMYGEYLMICFVFGIILLILSFFVGGFLTLLQRILGIFRRGRLITKEELRRKIEYEASLI